MLPAALRCGHSQVSLAQYSGRPVSLHTPPVSLPIQIPACRLANPPALTLRTFIQPLHPTSHLHTGFASMLEIDVPLLIDRCIVSIPSQPQGTLKAPPKASLMHAPQVSANNCRTNLIRDWPEPPAVPGGIVEAAPKDIALLANQNTSQQRPAIDASSQSRKCNISLDNVTVAGRDL